MSVSGFAAAGWFLLLVPVAALVAGYVWMLGRRRRHVLRFTRLELVDRIVPHQPGRRRHVPAAVLAVALVLLVVGLAGPTADARVPRNRAVVMLVIDVSLSMECTDVSPTRLAAAQDAAAGFAQQLTPGINLGLESFAGSATVLVTPTTDRAPVVSQIKTLKLAEATATGDALSAALDAVANFEATVPGGEGGPAPATIVLMSDGKQTIGRDEFVVAQQAARARVPVSTISFGTPYGLIDLAGGEVPVPVDDESLQRVAELSGGQFFSARSNRDVHDVYDTLREQIGYEKVRKDVSWAWFALGTLAAMVAAGSGLLLTQRLPA
ncbi:VWA domain-containing protein [Pseudonocardia acidicola]|uniref:VWA domain-containing protein n=1 Tax=Pseudonocardia acidicola TaxID=2724939 RepID=A0ABX1SEU0_9PSEU|nr:VWA domain-containing protein [Pseudonocardia acidicola]NMH99322.1 VWA domain-containing protein [Pseudonocardia acidicola]